MRDYLLFIDTEASGLPGKWNLPYSNKKNWPFIVQLAWIIYTPSGEEVKRENHYISNADFNISPQAIKIHGITPGFLASHGEIREVVMEKLAADLDTYKPVLIGHFVELDMHMLGADFYRAGLPNPAAALPTFCTMLATRHYVRNPGVKYLRLGELYTELFGAKLQNQHNALADAEATAASFFELVKKGEITEETLIAQAAHKNKAVQTGLQNWFFFIIISILILLLLTVFLV